MIRILFILAILLASVWLGVELHNDAGYVLIALRHWTIESTFIAFFIALVCLFFIINCLLISLHWVSDVPRMWRAWQMRRKAKQAMKKGDHEKKDAIQRMMTLNTSPEGYYTIGQLFDELKDSERACLAYREGLKKALDIS